MNAETRAKHVARQIDPLANWLTRFKPSCHVISIHRTDWALLVKPFAGGDRMSDSKAQKAADAIRSLGFIVNGDRVEYSGFELRPIETPVMQSSPPP